MLDGSACLSYIYHCLNIEFLSVHPALKFLSLPMPTYWKHCLRKPLNLNTYLHPLVAKWIPSGSPILLPKDITLLVKLELSVPEWGFLERLWV